MPSIVLMLLSSLIFLSHCDDLSDDATKDDSLIVQTAKGRVKGLTVQSLDKEVDVFYGIPYARAPVGQLRFRHPKPADPWTGILDATDIPNPCIQPKFIVPDGVEMNFTLDKKFSEDCLKLTVWVPRPRPKDAAVMVFIHGGAFVYGSANLPQFDPRVLCAEERIIIVSIAYRLASLGFLSLGRPDLPGNAGLLDQRLALEWVRDNIRYFGGDPQKVTLIGQSAGAASVSLHMLSPLSRDLFARAIVVSGSIPSPWLPMDPTANAKNGLRLAERLQCPHDPKNMDAVVECLRAKDPLDIVTAEQGMYGVFDFPFLPIVDGHFITEPVQESLSAKNFKKTELLIGVTSEEGGMFLITFLPEYFNLAKEIQLTRQEFMNSVKKFQPSLDEMVYEAIFFEYTDWNDPENPVANRDAVNRFAGDIYFICPSNGFASSYAEAGSEVYMYIFSHIPSDSAFPRWMGSLHGQDILFFFGQTLMPQLGFGEEEKKFSRTMMRYWANFARTGNPNRGPDGSFEPISWPLHGTADRQHLDLNANSIEVGKHFEAKRCAFWQEYVPKLMQYPSKQKVECFSQEQVKEESFWMAFVLEIMVAVVVIILIFLKLR